MIVTKKALSRRTFLRGLGATRGAAAAGRHDPLDDRAGQRRPPQPPAPPRLRLHADGLRHHALDASRRRTARSTSCRPPSARWRRSSEHVTVITQPGAAERLPRHARDLQLRLPERRQGEAHRERRLLPRHHRRPDRRPADRPGDAAAVARTVDGPDLDRRASATTATPASIRTTSRGRRRRRRCRARRIRGSSSSGSSAKAAAPPTAAPP